MYAFAVKRYEALIVVVLGLNRFSFEGAYEEADYVLTHSKWDKSPG